MDTRPPARAHARTGDRIAIAAHLGSRTAFDAAVGEFAQAYADQTERTTRRWSTPSWTAG
jgi:hypothetical protein